MEGENSTSGPQPYQPYEAEVTNSPISNTYTLHLLLIVVFMMVQELEGKQKVAYSLTFTFIMLRNNS